MTTAIIPAEAGYLLIEPIIKNGTMVGITKTPIIAWYCKVTRTEEDLSIERYPITTLHSQINNYCDDELALRCPNGHYMYDRVDLGVNEEDLLKYLKEQIG